MTRVRIEKFHHHRAEWTTKTISQDAVETYLSAGWRLPVQSPASTPEQRAAIKAAVAARRAAEAA